MRLATRQALRCSPGTRPRPSTNAVSFQSSCSSIVGKAPTAEPARRLTGCDITRSLGESTPGHRPRRQAWPEGRRETSDQKLYSIPNDQLDVVFEFGTLVPGGSSDASLKTA